MNILSQLLQLGRSKMSTDAKLSKADAATFMKELYAHVENFRLNMSETTRYDFDEWKEDEMGAMDDLENQAWMISTKLKHLIKALENNN